MYQRFGRTSMFAAMVAAVHNAHDKGINAGRIGRVVLTNEAKFGSITKPKQVPALLQKKVGS